MIKKSLDLFRFYWFSISMSFWIGFIISILFDHLQKNFLNKNKIILPKIFSFYFFFLYIERNHSLINLWIPSFLAVFSSDYYLRLLRNSVLSSYCNNTSVNFDFRTKLNKEPLNMEMPRFILENFWKMVFDSEKTYPAFESELVL